MSMNTTIALNNHMDLVAPETPPSLPMSLSALNHAAKLSHRISRPQKTANPRKQMSSALIYGKLTAQCQNSVRKYPKRIRNKPEKMTK